MFKRKTTIQNLTFVENRISNKTKSIVSKDISKLKLTELSYLLRESIATQVCINISLEKIKDIKIDFEFHQNSNISEGYRLLIRELLLVHEHHWDINIKAFEKLKDKISNRYFFAKLPQYVNDTFNSYEPKKLEWNENKVNDFNAYMNDTRVGVMVAYNMVHSLKRAVLNETQIEYNLGGDKCIIKSLKGFEEKILKSITCNEELLSMLEKEKTI